MYIVSHHQMLFWWCWLFVTQSPQVTAASGEPSCLSNICMCQTNEIASRLETQARCNLGRNKGYVPVFRTFTKTVSSLDLSRIELTTLRNQTFRALSTVRELYLNDNYMTKIETRAFAGIDHSIELLDLQHNRLQNLRFLTTHNFYRLRELLLRDNQLVQINPGTFTMMPSLESLNLDDNQISGPLTFLRQPALKALSNLNLDANRLRGIDPEDFLYLTNLKSLLVNRNELRNLNFLTDHIFKQLQGVSAASNHIASVDQVIFSDKNLIKWIDLSNNQLTEVNFLSSCSLVKLEEIYLSHNSLTAIPSDAFQATSYLTVFVVDNNKLERLPRCALSRFYSRMQTFDITDNPIQCDCQSIWLQQPHSITTERQSQCANLEFTNSLDYDISNCATLEACVNLDQCTTNNLVYRGVTSILVQEYSTTNSGQGMTTPTLSMLLVVIVGYLTISYI